MTASEPRPEKDLARPVAEDIRLAGVVHDVNQMLSVITGRTGLLLSQSDQTDIHSHLRAMALAADDAAAQRVAHQARRTRCVAASVLGACYP